MKKIQLLIAALAALAIIPATASASSPPQKESVCHRTGNGGYVLIPPSSASSHITSDGEKRRGHEGDYLASAAEVAAGKCGAQPEPTVTSQCVDNLVVVTVNGKGYVTETQCEVIRLIEVQGPERIVEVQGPERIVEKVVNIIGPERIVQLPPKVVTKTKTVVKYRKKVKRVNVCRVPKKRTPTPKFTG